MSDAQLQFRTATFGGFQKQDVLNYIETANQEHKEKLESAQREIGAVHVSDAVADYIVALTGATRTHPQLSMGASPRASRGLYRAAKVWAAMNGRDFVTPDDVKTLAHPVLEHRLVLESGARFSGVSAGAILDEILEKVSASPTLETAAHGD